MKYTLLFLLVLIIFQSCKFSSSSYVGMGYLELKTNVEALQELDKKIDLKSAETNDYMIYIYNHNGVLLSGYPKSYGEMASQITLTAGQYQVKVYSEALEKFPFPTQEEMWIYSGSQDFIINPDDVTKVEVTASLLTSKLEIVLTEEFQLGYPDYIFNIDGILLSSDKMDAIYVEGGKKQQVVLSYTENSEKVYRTFLTSEPLPKGTVVTLNFDYEGGTLETGDSNFNIIVDSSLDTTNINWDIADGELSNTDPTLEKGGKYNPYTISEAKARQDGSYAWVEGYIVGYIKSSINVITNYEEAKDSNIAIASTPGETNVANMLFVELSGSSSNVRKALGLSSTKGASFGYGVKLKGTLEKYYTAEGLKGVNTTDEYEIISR
ncbi:MAG: DUF6359 domain-containing protein [Mangrovibacterium sp.]